MKKLLGILVLGLLLTGNAYASKIGKGEIKLSDKVTENFIKFFKLLPVPDIKTAVLIFLGPVNFTIKFNFIFSCSYFSNNIGFKFLCKKFSNFI